MSSKNELISEHVHKFLTKLHTKTNHDKLFIGACTIELLRRAQQLDRAATSAIVSFISRVHDVPWSDIPFSVTSTVLVRGKEIAQQYGIDAEHVPDVLLSALVNFSDLVDGYLQDPDVTPEELFEAIVAEESEKFLQSRIVAAAAPAIYDHVMLRKCFKSAPVDDALFQSLGIACVTYRGMVAGVLGPILRGFAFSGVSDNWMLLLETGEFFSVPKGDPGLETAATPDDYVNVCPALLAYTTAASAELAAIGVITLAAAEKIAAGALGAFTKPVWSKAADRSAIQTLEQVLHPDSDSSVTGPTGAAVHFPAPEPDSQRCCVLAAVPAKDGAHVTAKLTEAVSGDNPTEKVILYLNHPRYFSARGVYLFPTDSGVICLRIMV